MTSEQAHALFDQAVSAGLYAELQFDPAEEDVARQYQLRVRSSDSTPLGNAVLQAAAAAGAGFGAGDVLLV